MSFVAELSIDSNHLAQPLSKPALSDKNKQASRTLTLKNVLAIDKQLSLLSVVNEIRSIPNVNAYKASVLFTSPNPKHSRNISDKENVKLGKNKTTKNNTFLKF